MGRLHFSDQKEENNLADKNLKTRIVNKNGTSAEWEKATSFVPKKGELILYTDLNKIKIGDGVTKVNDLPFVTDNYVSKTGDTMTGKLTMLYDVDGGKGGFIGFGENLKGGPIPQIGGGTNDDENVLMLQGDRISMFDANKLPLLNLSSTGALFKMPIAMFPLDSNDPKGQLSTISDGVALSAENGTCLKVGAQAVTVCDNAGGTTPIKGVKTPVDNTDAANKKYVDDAIPTAQIEELSSAVAKAEPFFVEATMTTSNEISVNKTFAEIKTASDAGKLCYARITNSGIIVPLVAFDLRVDKKVAVFSSSKLSISQFNTVSLLIAEDNSVSAETFSSQPLIEATGLLKGDGQGGITAAVAGTDYAAASHTHTKANITDFPTSMTPTAHKNTHKTGGSDALTPADIGAVAVTDLIAYTATEIDTMWNAVTIS